jgi:hypothetical protein
MHAPRASGQARPNALRIAGEAPRELRHVAWLIHAGNVRAKCDRLGVRWPPERQ